MSFIYPRLISIRRPNVQTGVGAIDYSGETADNETLVVSGLPASIQQKGGRQTKQALDLPADATTQLGWHIFIPKRSATLGLIVARDVVVDELNIRYVVFGPYWNSLGYNLLCELEQA